MKSSEPHPALELLRKYAENEGRPHFAFYRYGGRLLATDGRMLIRQNGLDPMFVDNHKPLPQEDVVRKWHNRLELFTVDTRTLRDWAGEIELWETCPDCKKSGHVAPYTDEFNGQIMEGCTVCRACDGEGILYTNDAPGYLTPARIVDRRYVSIFATMCDDFDRITVFASRGHDNSQLYFRIDNGLGRREFDAYLMPMDGRLVTKGIKAALWCPPRVLEGKNA